MSDFLPSEPAPRRRRPALVPILIALAFVVGFGLMLYAMRTSGRTGGWFFGDQPAAAPTAAAPAPQATVTPAAAPIPADVTRETALTAQIASLEARAAGIDAASAAAAGQAGRAEAMMVAFAARRAIDRGVPLGYLEEQLRQRFGATQPAAVTMLTQAARQPVTIAALRQALDANADLLATGGDGWLEGLRMELGNLVVLHDANTPSPLPADRLARARRLLDAGQVEAAQAEIARLPGAARAENWSVAAQRYVDAHKALDTIEAAALLVPVPVTAPVSPSAR